MTGVLSGLYYPFSRCIDTSSLKQMLLVFDKVTFVDPVDNEQWRAKLFRDLEVYDPNFARYKDVHAVLSDLVCEGCISRFDPGPFVHSGRVLPTASALRDLSDPKWVSVAANPQKYGMPSIKVDGSRSWQVFWPKLPEEFIAALKESPELRNHLLTEGGEWRSWSLSYAAGSAIGIGVHLDIAEELGLAPVTDSELHHRLLLVKLARGLDSSDKAHPIPDDAIRHLTIDIAATMLSQVLPGERLQEATFDDIIAFRNGTELLRKHFISDVETRLGQLRTVADAQEWIAAGRQVLAGLQAEFQRYQVEFTASRDKIWPGVATSLNSALVSGGLGAVAMSFIGGPGQALIGSIVGASIGALKTALDWRAERNRIQRSAAPSVAYLSRVTSTLN